MALFGNLSYTLFFAVLTWVLYSVFSPLRATSRSLLLWTSGAAALLILVHGLLRLTGHPKPAEQFFWLFFYSATLVGAQVMIRFAWPLFVRHMERHWAGPTFAKRYVQVADFIARKALFVVVYASQLLDIWYK